MIHKKMLTARMLFSVMVPVSAGAFALGILTVGHTFLFKIFTVWDGVSNIWYEILDRNVCGRCRSLPV